MSIHKIKMIEMHRKKKGICLKCGHANKGVKHECITNYIKSDMRTINIEVIKKQSEYYVEPVKTKSACTHQMNTLTEDIKLKNIHTSNNNNSITIHKKIKKNVQLPHCDYIVINYSDNIDITFLEWLYLLLRKRASIVLLIDPAIYNHKNVLHNQIYESKDVYVLTYDVTCDDCYEVIKSCNFYMGHENNDYTIFCKDNKLPYIVLPLQTIDSSYMRNVLIHETYQNCIFKKS